MVIIFVIINRSKERRGPGKYKFINSAYTFTLERYWDMTRNYRLIQYQSLIQDMYIKTQSIVNFAGINTKHGCCREMRVPRLLKI